MTAFLISLIVLNGFYALIWKSDTLLNVILKMAHIAITVTAAYFLFRGA